MKFEIDTSSDIVKIVKTLWENNFAYRNKLGFFREQIFLHGLDSILTKMNDGMKPVFQKSHGQKSELKFVK